jgi:UDP-glucose:(heptosyl)LPS alpha-1,3-glucosyltransferase
MKIALAIQHFRGGVGGAENIAVTVAAGLAARGHRMLVCAESGAAVPGIEFRQLPLAAVPAAAQAWGAEVVLDWGLNIPADVHRLGGGTHREFLNYALAASPVWLQWWKQLGYACLPKHRRTRAREQELILAPATRFIAVSEFVAAQLRRTAAPHDPAVSVILNGVDTQRFAPANRSKFRTSLRTRLGLATDDIAFLFVAHNLTLKNFFLLERVFHQLSLVFPDARLVVAGKRDPGIRAPWCVYAGASSSMEELYAGCDALLHPTWYDACANVVLEAMASGLPVVSSDRNGSAEAIQDGVSGRILPVAGDAVEIEAVWLEAVAALAGSKKLREQQGQAARTVAEAHGIEAYIAALEAELVKPIRDQAK